MIFPLDVQRTVHDAGRLVGNEKYKLIIFSILLGNGAMLFFTVPFLSGFGIRPIFPIVTQIILALVIFIFIFRFFIFKEDEKLREQQTSRTYSFSKYCNIRNIEPSEVIEVGNRLVPIFEYLNGSHFFVLQFRYGANNDVKSRNTRQVLENIYKTLISYNLDFKELIGKESFENSEEARTMIDSVMDIEDPVLAKTMMNIMREVLNVCEYSSNVDMLTLLVSTKFSYQRYEFEDIASDIFRIIDEEDHCFRSIEALDSKGLEELMKDFYGLEAIDFSLIRASSEDFVNEFESFVEIYQLISGDRKFVNDEALEGAMISSRRVK